LPSLAATAARRGIRCCSKALLRRSRAAPAAS